MVCFKMKHISQKNANNSPLIQYSVITNVNSYNADHLLFFTRKNRKKE